MTVLFGDTHFSQSGHSYHESWLVWGLRGCCLQIWFGVDNKFGEQGLRHQASTCPHPGGGGARPPPHLAPRSIRKAALASQHARSAASFTFSYLHLRQQRLDRNMLFATPTFDTQPRPSKCPCSAEWGKVPFANYMPVVPGFACDEKLDIIGQLSPACGSSSLQSYAQN